MKSPTMEKIDKFKRQFIKELLSQCTEEQQALFKRMYGSVDTMDEKNMAWAIHQCEATIKSNEEKAKEQARTVR
jgi:hypothetical protein